eukprot:364886-Chlamydomonas_euryale.AAC.11
MARPRKTPLPLLGCLIKGFAPPSSTHTRLLLHPHTRVVGACSPGSLGSRLQCRTRRRSKRVVVSMCAARSVAHRGVARVRLAGPQAARETWHSECEPSGGGSGPFAARACATS